MKTIARYDDKGSLESFVPVANGHKLSAREKLVVEEKPALEEGYELVGPDYRIETDRVVAVYRAEPVDQTRPDLLLARIEKLEQALSHFKAANTGLA